MPFRSVSQALASASLVAATAVAAPANAQRVDNIVAFGDSYADDGNLFEIIGFNPAPQVYPTGRFSGGTNYVDTLSVLLNAPVQNFAIGGALTDNSNTNGVGIPGFATEWNAFLAGGGGPFPTVSGTLDASDLVTVSIGGNDARFYEQSGGTLAGAPTAAASSVGFATAGLDALVDAGAQTISFLAGNTAILPEIAGDTDAQAIRNAYSTAFNTSIQGVLAGYAADGVTVHYLDLELVAERIAADPSAYGLVSAGPCTPAPQCLTNTAFANQHLFYVDFLHLTSAGFAIVADYVATQLTAPLVLQAPSDLAFDTARQFGRTLSLRNDLNERSAAPGLHAFVTGDYFSRSVGSSQTNDAFDIDGAGITAGVEYGLPVGVVGVAANYSRPRVRFGNEAFRDNARSFQLGAFGALSVGSAFAQAHIGYGSDRHRLSRAGVIDNMTARPDGNHVVAGAKAGYLMPFGPVRIGPVAGLDYARAKVDAYTEEGDAALTLNVSEQSLKALTGSLGVELRGAAAGPGLAFRPFASALLEKDFTGDERTLVYAQTSAPGIVNSFNYADRSTRAHGRLTAGASATILGGIALDAAASTTVGKKQGNELSGHVGLRIAF